MNREETAALWRKGKDAWDLWQRGLQKEKQAYQRGGTWELDWYGEGQTGQTVAWLEDATADFSGTEFETVVDFAGVVFPGLSARPLCGSLIWRLQPGCRPP